MKIVAANPHAQQLERVGQVGRPRRQKPAARQVRSVGGSMGDMEGSVNTLIEICWADARGDPSVAAVRRAICCDRATRCRWRPLGREFLQPPISS